MAQKLVDVPFSDLASVVSHLQKAASAKGASGPW